MSDCKKMAMDFINRIDEEVEIWHKIQCLYPDCQDAKEFCAWWSLMGYCNDAGVLIYLYECWEDSLNQDLKEVSAIDFTVKRLTDLNMERKKYEENN